MSDHLSSYRSLRDPVTDICDLYAFPTPEHPGRLSLIMTVFPGARPGAAFSDAVAYRIRLRSLDLPRDRGWPGRLSSTEHSVTVTFSNTGDDGGREQVGTCRIDGRRPTQFVVGQPDAGAGHDLRVFAGLRRDPFFMDVAADVRTRATGRLAFEAEGSNSVADLDVLGIVIDLDIEAVLGADGGPVFAVVCETTTLGSPASRFERFGRPEVKNILLSQNGKDATNRDVDLRDLYNLEDPFAVSSNYMSAFRTRIDANLRFFDTLDGPVAWPVAPGEEHPLVDMFLPDYLVIDVSRPYSEGTFLEIERAMADGQPHATCGGRPPNDDVIDTFYTLVTNGWHGQPVSDGVDEPSVLATKTFPYLAAPNEHPPVPRPGVPTGPEDS